MGLPNPFRQKRISPQSASGLGAAAFLLLNILPLPTSFFTFLALGMAASPIKISETILLLVSGLILALGGALFGLSVWVILYKLRSLRIPIVLKGILGVTAISVSGIVSAFLLLVMFGACYSYITRIPSDQAMQDNFSRHQAQFDLMAHILENNKPYSSFWAQIPVNPKNRDLEGFASSAQREQCRSLMNKCGSVLRVSKANNGNLKFTYYSDGMAITDGTEKGYAYLTKPPANILPNLDSCHAAYKDSYRAYRPIGGRWYIYYEHTSG